jgi:hypothetical protein
MEPTTAELAAAIAKLVREQKFRYRNEIELHRGLSMLFTLAGLSVEQEVMLTPADRIDFLILGVGIEVKVKGSTPRVADQLRRYAQHPRIQQLVLVTSRGKHRSLDGEIYHDVPVTVARLPWL